ncbi:MAG: sulfatase-like hydrolase/transferase, partial [Bellilinea sp.]
MDGNLNRSWLQILAAVILASYLYAFFEWVFFISQPSYSSGTTNPLISISVFLFSGLTIAGVFTGLVILLYLLFILIPLQNLRAALTFLAKLLLAFLLACLLLLLIDNFTYTLFNIGIVTSTGVFRAVYTVVFLVLIYLIYRRVTPYVGPVSEAVYRRRRWRLITAIILLLLSLLSVFTTNLGDQPVKADTTPNLAQKPNILIIGSDGLDASNLSPYGYERDTTPNLAAFAVEALVAENAYSNSLSSAGSVISLLSSKLPTTTRVLYPPDILTGQNALEHLPGILKEEGYRNVEITMPFYIDAFSMNMQQGFDIVNNRSIENYPILYTGWRIGGDYPFYFITITIERISSRLKHILFIETMENPYAEVTTGLGTMMTDRERTDQLISLLRTSTDPLFIHLQFIGTHGPYYYPEERYYATAPSQVEPDDDDFYDDAIRDFDRNFGEVLQTLEERGMKENTIIAFYSDHSRKKTVNRIPWMIRFPNADHAGTISQNVQNLDFAPTLLDYLNMPIPAWMEGMSMLERSIPPDRPIFVSSVAIDKLVEHPMWIYLDNTKVGPPFYQFGYQSMIVCNQVYEVDLNANSWTTFTIPNHTSPCDPAALPTMEQAKVAMINHLAEQGFDITSVV